MATLVAAPPWIPEDDLLLKNAVEGGASLEALAKGAVQFSRKFTVAEIRERWHSLLYDPTVSAEASARMTESELSAKKSGNGNKNSEVASKRKFESIRRLYCAMQKGICRDSSILELSDMNYLMDLTIVEEGNLNGYERDDSYGGPYEQARVFSLKQSARCCEDSAQQKNTYNEFPVTCGDRAELQEEIGCSDALPNSSASHQLLKFSTPNSRHSSWKHIENKSKPGMQPGLPMNVSLGDKVLGQAILPHDTKEMLPDEHNGDQIGEIAAISDRYLMDISDCLLHFENEDDLVSMDMDGKAANNVGQDVKDQKRRVTGDSFILNGPDDKHEDSALIPGDVRMMEGARCLGSQGSAPAGNLDSASGKLDTVHADKLQLCSLEFDKPSSAAKSSTLFLVEMYDEPMVCTLNSEDPEIPCNDDFPSSATCFCSTIQQSEQTIFEKEADIQESASIIYQATGKHTQAGTGPNYHAVKAGSNCEVSNGQCAAVILKESTDVQLKVNPCRLPTGSRGCAKGCTLVDKSSATDFPMRAADNSCFCNIPELDGSPSKMDYDQDESDSLIPNFADIEAMILDMDLWPKYRDSCASKEVSLYKNEESRRAIIRLEQCAHSSVQRAIGSQGALAVLYGRCSKHYISKAEVILGRSSDDFDVDIDLVREGGTNRISRRQALIKLEREGSFSLKNLGKNLMFVNGKEVYSGDCIRLTPSCLIEVKGTAFIFEMNDKSVRQYLGKIAHESRNENSSFERSPEGVSLSTHAVLASPS